MTDLTASLGGATLARIESTSPEARARLKARYRADTRFRLYGIGALTLATAFLAVLVVDVASKGLPAFWQHALVVDVPVPGTKIDPDGKRSPEAIRGGDYQSLAREALATLFPGLSGRTAKKKLNEILSSGASDELRTAVVANPALLDSTVKTRLLLSDDADLYFKGEATAVTVMDKTQGAATPSDAAGDITIRATGADFAPLMAGAKALLAKRAAKLNTEVDRLSTSKSAGAKERMDELAKEAKALSGRAAAASATETLDSRMPSLLVTLNGGTVKLATVSPSEVTGQVIVPLTSAAEAKPGSWQIVTYDTPESDRNIDDVTVAYLEHLKAMGKVERHFNWTFFTAGDSREAELAGIRGSLVGTLMTLAVTLVLCLPIGVMAAVYLEEFAPKNRLTDFVEININNLAAVPSIVFGLLGLAVFLNFFGLPRSAPLVGGLVLALLVLPTIIIASRAALRAVPPSIREGALAVGASQQQAILHHVLPLAVPGIMTGSIIGMAHALGETAPLLMIGMIAFIVDVPKSLTEAATVLPVQIYLWSDLPEPAFRAKTAAAIIVLLVVLFVMNGAAIWLRRRFERRW